MRIRRAWWPGVVAILAVGCSRNQPSKTNQPANLAVYVGPRYKPRCLAFSPDGKLLVVGTGAAGSRGSAGEVVIWDVAQREPIQRLMLNSPVSSLAFTPKGAELVGTVGGRIHVWEGGSWRLLNTIGGTRRFGQDTYSSIRILPDGKELLVRGEYGGVRVLRLPDGQVKKVIQGHWSSVWKGAAGPGIAVAGDLIAYGRQGEVVVTDMQSSTTHKWTVPKLPGRRYQPVVAVIGFSPTGEVLVTMRDHAVIDLWDVTKQRIARSLVGSWIWCAALSPDGRILALGSKDVSLLDVASGKPIERALLDSHHVPTCVSFSPDGTMLAWGEYRRSGGEPVARVLLWNRRIDTDKPR